MTAVAQSAREMSESTRAKDPRIAYFCMEFGIAGFLKLYSGGLGILAGDHLKAASDLDLPWPPVPVGLTLTESGARPASAIAEASRSAAASRSTSARCATRSLLGESKSEGEDRGRCRGAHEGSHTAERGMLGDDLVGGFAGEAGHDVEGRPAAVVVVERHVEEICVQR